MSTEMLEALSVIATLLGAIGSILGSVNLTIRIKSKRKNTVSRNKINNSKVDIGDKIYNGATLEQLEKCLNNRIEHERKPFGVSLDKLKELAPIFEKDKRYFIPVVWIGAKVEYNKLVTNGNALDEVIYIITDEE